jgi:dihydroflavonol-4-reductase
MKVLVTGATGFLGGWVARELCRASHAVTVLVRSRNKARSLEKLGIAVAEGDLLDPRTIESAASRAEAVVHCAASTSLRPRDRESLLRTNVEGTYNVLRLSADRGLRVLHTSSIAAIGPSRTPEVLDESASPLELDFDYPYARSKRDSERLALSFARQGHDVLVLNPGILLGPGDAHFSSTEFIMRYLKSQLGVHLSGGGSFADVRDVAKAYVTALDAGKSGERYILAGINRSYGGVLDELRALTGLQRSTKLPRGLAELGAIWSELGGMFVKHPLEKFNTAVVRWGSLFNYCDVAKARAALGYRTREFTTTLIDTVVDHLRRGVVRASTAELRAMLERNGAQERVMTQRLSSRTKRLSRDSGKRPKHASSS